MFKERYISSVKSCKYLNNKFSIKTMVLTFFKNYVYAHNPFNKVSEKEKYTLHTTTWLWLFMSAFCNTHVQNLLKAPETPCQIYTFPEFST